jgi:hypothetical protein
VTAQRSTVGNIDLLFPQGGAYLTFQKHEYTAIAKALGIGRASVCRVPEPDGN